MRSKYSTAFQTVKEIENNLANLQLSKDIYSTPYTGKPLATKSEYVEGEQMYATEDIAFVNTKEFSKTGDYFLKKVYIQMHTLYMIEKNILDFGMKKKKEERMVWYYQENL